MDIKIRLQRVLQIVEGAERAGGLSELDKDIALNELREAYAELKFGVRETEELKTENEEVAEVQVAESAKESAAELPITPTEKSEEIEDNLSTLNSQLSNAVPSSPSTRMHLRLCLVSSSTSHLRWRTPSLAPRV